MARFCAECGSPLEEGARFCGECGAPVEEQVPEKVPEAAQTQTPVFEPVSGAPVALKEKKPLPKWLKPAVLAALAVAVALAGTSLILRSANTPEKTMEKFLSAMEAGELGALNKVAYVDGDELELTEQTAQPMFRLYASNKDFRNRLENTLEEDVDLLNSGESAEGKLVTLEEKKGFLHTSYQVVLHLCDVNIYSSFGAVTVTLDNGRSFTIPSNGSVPADDSDTVYAKEYADVYGQDYLLTQILPGLYDVQYTYETGYGETVQGQQTLPVLWYGSDCYLETDLVAPIIYNDSRVEIEIFAEDKACLSILGGAEGYLGPMAADTKLEARADVGLEEPMTQELSASEEYVSVSFELCEVSFYNSTKSTLKVYRGEELLGAIEPYDSYDVQGLPSGTQLQVRLMENEDVISYYHYVCEAEYDTVTPSFELKQEAEQALAAAVQTHLDTATNCFNQGDLAALEKLPESWFVDSLEELLEYGSTEIQQQIKNVVLEPDFFDVQSAEDGAVTVRAWVDLSFGHEILLSGESFSDEEYSLYLDFLVRYADGAWSVVDDDEII